MARKDRDGVLPEAVDADHSGVFVLVLDIRCDSAHADAHGTDEDEGVEVVPALADVGAGEDTCAQFSFQFRCDFAASLADGYNGYLLHFSIVIG